MPSGYPTSLDTLATNKTDGAATAVDHVTHHNDMADAINKIEAELGTDPSSASYATVKAAIAALLPLLPLGARITAPANVSPASGFGHYADPYGPATYHRDAANNVTMEGLLLTSSTQNYTANQLLATVPAGFRPIRNAIFVVGTRGGGVTADMDLRVQTDGTIRTGDRGGTANPIEWISLGGVTYRAA